MGDRINEGFFYKKMYGLFAGPKKVAVIRRCRWGLEIIYPVQQGLLKLFTFFPADFRAEERHVPV